EESAPVGGRAFDEFTKRLATRATSRRGLLKGAAAATVSAAVGSRVESALATHNRPCRQIGDNCRSNAECCHRYCDSISSTCACPAGVTCNRNSNCRDVGDNCRANADCCLGICNTQTFQCVCPPEVPGCTENGQCREVGANCSSSAECCSGFCDSSFHCSTCPPGTQLCRGSCIPQCQTSNPCAISVCNPLTGSCELQPANPG